MVKFSLYHCLSVFKVSNNCHGHFLYAFLVVDLACIRLCMIAACRGELFAEICAELILECEVFTLLEVHVDVRQICIKLYEG